jgi:hypothetical protein
MAFAPTIGFNKSLMPAISISDIGEIKCLQQFSGI